MSKENEQNKDLYDILGVSKDFNTEEIKKAYKKLSKKYHPDNLDTGDEELFKKIVEARNILIDEDKRAEYDATGNVLFVMHKERIQMFIRANIIPSIISCTDLKRIDVLSNSKEYLNHCIKEQHLEIVNLERDIPSYTEAKRRIRRTDGNDDENYFLQILNEKQAELKSQISHYKNEIKFYKIVGEYLDNYEFLTGELYDIEDRSEREETNEVNGEDERVLPSSEETT